MVSSYGSNAIVVLEGSRRSRNERKAINSSECFFSSISFISLRACSWSWAKWGSATPKVPVNSLLVNQLVYSLHTGHCYSGRWHGFHTTRNLTSWSLIPAATCRLSIPAGNYTSMISATSCVYPSSLTSSSITKSSSDSASMSPT